MRVYLFASILFVSCMSEPEPTAQVKKTVQSNPGVFIYERLFEELIGRKLGNDIVVDLRDKDNNDSALISSWLDLYNNDAGDSEKLQDGLQVHYEKAVNLILNSQQYLDEGFLHLHKRRLLLFHQGEANFMRNASTDYYSLQAELRDVAAADNYWQLFTYRDRYFALNEVGITGACVDFSSMQLSKNSECIKFLLASFLQNYQHHETCYMKLDSSGDANRKFSSIYYNRCGDGSIATEDIAFCDEVNNGYEQLLGKSYREVASATVSTCSYGEYSNKEGTSDEEDISNDPMYTKVEENFLPLIYFYISLYLSEGMSKFVKVTQPSGSIDSLVRIANYRLFLKTNVPADLQGIHANPFWLSRHRTNVANMSLHRARLLLYSWFCEDVSPDAASLGGGTIDAIEKERLKDYFDKNDIHTFGDNNCFNCHKRVQPLGNYFGKLSFGVPYHDSLEFSRYTYRERLLAINNSFDRPAGYYDIATSEFFAECQGRGMAALAELLSKHPRVRQCIVTATWNGIFGNSNQLSSAEVDGAVEVFAQNNFSYKSLLQYMLLSKKARTYFIEGEKALSALIAAEQLTCKDAEQNDAGSLHGKSPQDIFGSTCNMCHTNGLNQSNVNFLSSDGKFIEDSGEGVFNEVYKRVSWGSQSASGMPMGGYNTTGGFPSADKQKTLLLCFLQSQAEQKGITLQSIELPEVAKEIDTPVSQNHQGGAKE